MALNVTQKDLQFQDKYSWTAEDGDNPKIIGAPDRNLFDRSEGYETLSLIQNLVDDLKIDNIDDVYLIEDWIWNDIPTNEDHRDTVIFQLRMMFKMHKKKSD